VTGILYGNLRAEIVGSDDVRLQRVTLRHATHDLFRPSWPGTSGKPLMLGRDRDRAEQERQAPGRCGLAWPSASRANPVTPTRRTIVRGDMNWRSGIEPASAPTNMSASSGRRASARRSRLAWAG
jgi:hypothetical protein